MKNKKELENRFAKFLMQLSTTENIDDLVVPKDRIGTKKADYFLDSKEYTVEIKNLEQDPNNKIDSILEPHTKRPEFPIFYGTMDAQKVLSRLPDGQEINKQLFFAVTDRIEKNLKDANKQIRETKQTFNVPNSLGICVMLNQDIDLFSPDFVAWRTKQVLGKKSTQGYCYKNIDYVILVSEAHYISNVLSGTKMLPVIVMSKPDLPDNLEAEKFLFDVLVSGWAKFNDAPIFNIGTNENFQHFEYSKNQTESGKITRQEFWERNYREQPYLRNIPANEFKKYSSDVMAENSIYYLKKKVSHKDYDHLASMEKLYHVIQEANYRGLDIKEVFDRDYIKTLIDKAENAG